MNEIKQLRCKAVFDSNIEKINPLFSKVKIRIAYTGVNRNNSYISKEAFENALPTIYNCPIIGEFIETVDDFGSHGGKIEISDKGIKYIQTTKPYGVINETSEITWEDIAEEDGTINTYLCATGYLWTGRYDELYSVIQNSKSQSMEIDVSKGEFKEINKNQVYSIDEFIFSAFCILGDSVEPCFESSEITSYNFNKDEFKAEYAKMLDELKQYTKSQQKIDSYFIEKEKAEELVSRADNIFKELGFSCVEWVVDGKENQITGIINKTLNEEASKNWGFNIYDKDTITIFTNDLDKLDTSSISISSVELLLSKNDNIQNFSLIPKKLEQSDFNINSNKNGGNNLVDEKLELLSKYNLTVENVSFNIEELSLDEIEIKIKEQFALLASQKQEEIANALRVEKYIDRWGDEYSRYSYVEHNDTDVFAYDKQDNWNLYGFTYSMSGDKVIIDFGTKKRKKFQIVDFDDGTSSAFELFPKEAVDYEVSSKEKELSEKFTSEKETAVNEIQEKLNTITTEYENVKPEFERLQNFESDKLQAERTEQETELFSKYDEILDSEDESYKAIKETKSDFSIEELESKLAVLYTRKKLNFSSNKNNKIIKLGGDSDNTGELSPYGNLFEKHGVNNNKEEK